MEHESLTIDVIHLVILVAQCGLCYSSCNLEYAKGTGVNLSVLKVSDFWFHSNSKAVALNLPSSKDRNTIVMLRWLHSNLGDKVLFEGESIVVNEAESLRAYGLLEAFIWDSYPISYC